MIPTPHSLRGSRCGVSLHTIPSGLCSWVSPLEQQVLSKASGFQGRRGEQTPTEETDPATGQSDCSSIREKLCGVHLPIRTDIEGRPQVAPRSPRQPWPAARPQGSPRCKACWLPAGPRAQVGSVAPSWAPAAAVRPHREALHQRPRGREAWAQHRHRWGRTVLCLGPSPQGPPTGPPRPAACTAPASLAMGGGAPSLCPWGGRRSGSLVGPRDPPSHGTCLGRGGPTSPGSNTLGRSPLRAPELPSPHLDEALLQAGAQVRGLGGLAQWALGEPREPTAPTTGSRSRPGHPAALCASVSPHVNPYKKREQLALPHRCSQPCMSPRLGHRAPRVRSNMIGRCVSQDGGSWRTPASSLGTQQIRVRGAVWVPPLSGDSGAPSAPPAHPPCRTSLFDPAPLVLGLQLHPQLPGLTHHLCSPLQHVCRRLGEGRVPASRTKEPRHVSISPWLLCTPESP